MTTKAWALEMALYGKWQNAGLFGLCDALADGERKRDRGMFFGSIHHRAQVTSELHRKGIDYGNTDLPYNPHSQY